MAIFPKDVEALSRLARIQLTDEELTCFAGQLEEILSHVEKLKAAKTDGVPPTSHVLPLSNVFREDKLQPSLPVDQGLASARLDLLRGVRTVLATGLRLLGVSAPDKM